MLCFVTLHQSIYPFFFSGGDPEPFQVFKVHYPLA